MDAKLFVCLTINFETIISLESPQEARRKKIRQVLESSNCFSVFTPEQVKNLEDQFVNNGMNFESINCGKGDI